LDALLGAISEAVAVPQRTPKYKQRGQNRLTAKSTRVPLMADAENITRWIVDQHFRDTQLQLGIPLGEFPALTDR